MDFASPQFWVAVLQIIAIDILLSGDNAVVIALACRRLPEEQRRKGILWGVAGAVALRVALLFFALQLLTLPFLKLVGGALLLRIGIQLLAADDGEGSDEIAANTTLIGAIQTIIVADVVMSLDNVIGIAGAAHGNFLLIVLGIGVSIPLIVWGSQFVLRLMDRFPAIVTLGGALLGWIAGEMLIGDAALADWAKTQPAWLPYAAKAGGAIAVVLIGKWQAARNQQRRDRQPVVDLATTDPETD